MRKLWRFQHKITDRKFIFLVGGAPEHIGRDVSPDKKKAGTQDTTEHKSVEVLYKEASSKIKPEDGGQRTKLEETRANFAAKELKINTNLEKNNHSITEHTHIKKGFEATRQKLVEANESNSTPDIILALDPNGHESFINFLKQENPDQKQIENYLNNLPEEIPTNKIQEVLSFSRQMISRLHQIKVLENQIENEKSVIHTLSENRKALTDKQKENKDDAQKTFTEIFENKEGEDPYDKVHALGDKAMKSMEHITKKIGDKVEILEDFIQKKFEEATEKEGEPLTKQELVKFVTDMDLSAEAKKLGMTEEALTKEVISSALDSFTHHQSIYEVNKSENLKDLEAGVGGLLIDFNNPQSVLGKYHKEMFANGINISAEGMKNKDNLLQIISFLKNKQKGTDLGSEQFTSIQKTIDKMNGLIEVSEDVKLYSKASDVTKKGLQVFKNATDNPDDFWRDVKEEKYQMTREEGQDRFSDDTANNDFSIQDFSRSLPGGYSDTKELPNGNFSFQAGETTLEVDLGSEEIFPKGATGIMKQFLSSPAKAANIPLVQLKAACMNTSVTSDQEGLGMTFLKMGKVKTNILMRNLLAPRVGRLLQPKEEQGIQNIKMNYGSIDPLFQTVGLLRENGESAPENGMAQSSKFFEILINASNNNFDKIDAFIA